jgi:hypothetical protein
MAVLSFPFRITVPNKTDKYASPYGVSGDRMKREQQSNILLFTLLLCFGAGGRILLEEVPNLETIMVATFLGALFLGRNYAMSLPLLCLLVSDYFMGHLTSLSGMHAILLFTYTGFLFVGAYTYRNRTTIGNALSQIDRPGIYSAAGLGMAFVMIYDMWTNLGAFWLMYPHTAAGLALCYYNAIPFMLMHLLSGAVTFVCAALPASWYLRNVMPLPDDSPARSGTVSAAES